VDPRTSSTPIRTLCLTAFAVLLAIGFLGASSAIAETTALCQIDESPCGAGNGATSLHETSVGKAKLLTSIGTIECSVLFASTSVGAAGNPQKIEGNFTYSECKLGSSSCTVSEENGPAGIQVSREGTEKAKVTGEYLFHPKCTGFIDCSFTGTGLAGTFKGPLSATQANGEVTISEQSMTKEAGGFLCPKTNKLDITTTPLTATYIANGVAQAAEQVWMINGESMPAISLKEESLSLSGALNVLVPGKFTVECKVVEGAGKIFESGTDELKAKLTKCEVAKAPGCKISEPVSMEVTFGPIPVGSSYYDKVVPLKEGGSLMTLKLGKECEFGEEITVKGSVAAEMSLEAKEKQPLTFSEAITKEVNEGLKLQSEAELSLKAGESTAYLSGELLLALSGEAHQGQQMLQAPVTRLCSTLTNPCQNILGFNQNVKIEHEGNVKFTYEAPAGAVKEVICGGWKMEGTLIRNSLPNAGPVEGNNITGAFAANGCTIGGNVCTVTMLGAPWRINLRATQPAAGRGLVTVIDVGFKFVCGGKTCGYEAVPQLSFYEWGTPGKAKQTPFNIVRAGAVSDADCSIIAVWEAVGGAGDFAYKFTEPGTLALTR
jgi:hypothetical protein